MKRQIILTSIVIAVVAGVTSCGSRTDSATKRDLSGCYVSEAPMFAEAKAKFDEVSKKESDGFASMPTLSRDEFANMIGQSTLIAALLDSMADSLTSFSCWPRGVKGSADSYAASLKNNARSWRAIGNLGPNASYSRFRPALDELDRTTDLATSAEQALARSLQ
jgi:hypothetical protein